MTDLKQDDAVEPSAATAEEPSSKAEEQDAGPQNPELEKQVIDVLKTCFDPEIPVDIYALGLIYNIATNMQGLAHVKMTLTSPACPVAGTLPPEVERKIKAIPDAKDVRVELVWDPPWEPSRMSEAAKLQLNMF